MKGEAHEAYAECPKGCLFVADAREHVAGGDAHEQVCGKVHQVAEHARPFIGVFPNCAHGGGEVRHERNHGKEEEHCDNCHHIRPLLSG